MDIIYFTRGALLPCSQVQESVAKLVLLPLERLALYRPAEVGLRHHDWQSSQHHLVSTELVSALELQMKVKQVCEDFTITEKAFSSLKAKRALSHGK